MSKILCCPFCGCNDRRVGIRRMGNKGYKVICGKCGSGGPYVAIKEWHDNKFVAQGQAIEAWNTRKPMERIVEQLEVEKETHKFLIQHASKTGAFIEQRQREKAVEVCERAIEILKAGGVDG